VITYEQAVNLKHGDILHVGKCVKTVGPRGGVTTKVERYRVASSVKTWVTRPGQYQFTVRYGIQKTTSVVTHCDADLLHLESECPIND